MIQFLIAFLTSFLITPIIIWLYKKNNWLDKPEKDSHVKKTHSKAVPRGGGLVIFFGVLVTTAIFLKFDYQLVAILIGALILTIVGTLDDIYDLHPGFRILSGLLAGLVVVGSGIGIAYITNPFGAGVIHLDQPQIHFNFLGSQRSIWALADLLALVFILWNMNIVNWSKGVDGQMPGFVSIALIFVGILSTRFIDDPAQFNTAYLSFIVSGTFAGFLIWNWYPQKIMPGYGAGSLAGYFLAILAILSGAKIATVFMVLGLPTADAIFTILRRIIAGKSPLWGDRGHMHHKLLDVLKWGRRRIAIFYWLSSFLLGVLSLYLNTAGKLTAMLVVLILVFSFLIWAKITTMKLNKK
ncbi:undecaprenyl/decaprenyl-phosphate alpha-N-acetylglucosaminyl 1-phosphate transferase [Candidatus Woesebacteria bacterium]|nr:undecaprenyl/decaprenyl-phosphate alpha-N-acetylglucosaminyl 1-phosphate transferase [Candidatus Woesebacteria bacterium]